MPNERDRKDIQVEVLIATFESVTEQVVEGMADRLLASAVSAAIRHPVAAVLAGVARALITGIFDKTREIEGKVDQIIDEPFQTAVTSFKEVMNISAETSNEQVEVQRRLGVICDRLQTAYTYAEKKNQTRLLGIRSYQALTAAMTIGGRPFMELYLKDLRSAAQDLFERAESIELQARKRFGTLEEHQEYLEKEEEALQSIRDFRIESGEYSDLTQKDSSWARDPYYGRDAVKALVITSVDSQRAIKEHEEAELQIRTGIRVGDNPVVAEHDKAERLRRTGGQIEDFCRFTATLAAKRTEVI